MKLRHLDLTGCENITDVTLVSLASVGRKYLDFSAKDGGSVEIENVPPPCNEKVRVCCSQRIKCMAYMSDGNCQDASVDRLIGGEGDCEHANVDVCDGASDKCHDLMPAKNSFMLQQENTNSRGCSGSLLVDHALNFVYKNIHLTSDETFSTSCRSSLPETSSDICPTPQTCCDNETAATDLLLKMSSPSSSQRTCVGEAWKSLKTLSGKQCCKESKCVSADEHPRPQPRLDCVGTGSCVPAACTNTNHKEPEDSNPAVSGAEDRGSRLEYLSLNGCYRISDVGLRYMFILYFLF